MPFLPIIGWLYERVLTTKWFYPITWITIAGLVFFGGQITYILAEWKNFPTNIFLFASPIIATLVTYYLLVRGTGCPHCRNYLPFQRKEMDREAVRTFERSFKMQQHSPAGYGQPERSWDQITYKVYRVYQVKYQCKDELHEWEEEIEKQEKEFIREFEQPPSKYRPMD